MRPRSPARFPNSLPVSIPTRRRSPARAFAVATAAAVVAALGACGGGGGGGQSPTTPSLPPPSGVTTGRTVGVLDGQGVAGITIRSGSAVIATSDASGSFVLQPQGATGRQALVFSGPQMIDRTTGITVPGPHADVSLLPAGFDLAAFDQFCRVQQLQRWTAPPRLHVVTAVTTFTSTGDTEYAATGEQLTSGELADLIADLVAGLGPLTADRFTDFAARTTDTPAAGARVSMQQTGVIVVARSAGLQAASGFWGYARWATREDGAVVAGSILLDRDFELSGSVFRASLRRHELGHALGYTHVTNGRESVMNPTGRVIPNDWDRQAALIAFSRPPGNRAPDVDPAAHSSNLTLVSAAGPITWGPAIP